MDTDFMRNRDEKQIGSEMDTRLYKDGVVLGMRYVRIGDGFVYTVIQDDINEYSIHKVVGKRYGRRELALVKEGFKTPNEASSFLHTKMYNCIRQRIS